MSKDRFFIIDASGYVFRAYHAIQPLSNSRGEPTHAILGFCTMLHRLLDTEKPTYVAVVFDSKSPTFRKTTFSGYKATRPPPPEDLSFQIAECQALCQPLGLSMYQVEGVEADDIIATLCARMGAESTIETVVVTADKDLMQLVSERTRIFDSMRNVWYGPEEVESKFGVPPSKVRDYLAIVGDSSDNIPGVLGIGPKGAVELLKQFSSLDEIYRRMEEIPSSKVREKLLSAKESAFLSQELVTLKADLPLEFDLARCRVGEPNRAELADRLNRFEFRQLSARFKDPDTQKISTEQKYRLIQSRAELKALLEEWRRAELLVIDVETTSLDPIEAELVGLSGATRIGEAAYIALGHRNASEFSRAEALDAFRPILTDPRILKAGHNMKFDYLVLRNQGVRITPIAHDSMVMSYLLRPGSRSHGLDALALKEFNYSKIAYTDLVGKGSKQLSFADVDTASAAAYGGEDADFTLRLIERYRTELKSRALDSVYSEIEMPLVQVLADMEANGVRIDVRELKEQGLAVRRELARLQREIFSACGTEFNLNSPTQLGKVLFETLKLPVLQRTKTGPSTNEEVLSALAKTHPVPALVLEYRTLSKLNSTYIDALPEMVSPRTGRVHASYNQTVTATGRLSSSDPNLQNIPIRSPVGRRIREAFVADPGYVLITADYSQVELRILAHLSDDPALIAAFEADRDIHTETARTLFSADGEEVSSEMRRRAKAINFGIVYGMSDYGLSRELGIHRSEAERIIRGYFSTYPKVRALLDRFLADARATGITRTAYGRLREIPELRSPNPSIRQLGERLAINTPIQGTAADIIKLAMIRLHEEGKQWGDQFRLIIQVHDELVFEVSKEILPAASEKIRSVMESVGEFKVPLKVEMGTGSSWAAAAE